MNPLELLIYHSISPAPFILSPTSLTGTCVPLPVMLIARLHGLGSSCWVSVLIDPTEFPAYWLERPGLFSAIADGVDAEDRALRVLRWFIVSKLLASFEFSI